MATLSSLLTPFASWDGVCLVLVLFGPLCWMYMSNFIKKRSPKKKKSGILRGGKYAPEQQPQILVDGEKTSLYSWEFWMTLVLRCLIWILKNVWRLLVWAFARTKRFLRQTWRRYFDKRPSPQVVQFAEQPDGTIRTTSHTFDPKEAPSSDRKKRPTAIHLSTTIPSSTNEQQQSNGDGFTTPTNQQQQQQPLRKRAQLHTPPPPPGQWKQDITMSEEKKQEVDRGETPQSTSASKMRLRHNSMFDYRQSPFMARSTRTLPNTTPFDDHVPFTEKVRQQMAQEKRSPGSVLIKRRRGAEGEDSPSSATTPNKRLKFSTTRPPLKIPSGYQRSSGLKRASKQLSQEEQNQRDAWLFEDFSRASKKAKTPASNENTTPNAMPTGTASGAPRFSFASKDAPSAAPASASKDATSTPAFGQTPPAATPAPTPADASKQNFAPSFGQAPAPASATSAKSSASAPAPSVPAFNFQQAPAPAAAPAMSATASSKAPAPPPAGAAAFKFGGTSAAPAPASTSAPAPAPQASFGAAQSAAPAPQATTFQFGGTPATATSQGQQPAASKPSFASSQPNFGFGSATSGGSTTPPPTVPAFGAQQTQSSPKPAMQFGGASTTTSSTAPSLPAFGGPPMNTSSTAPFASAFGGPPMNTSSTAASMPAFAVGGGGAPSFGAPMAGQAAPHKIGGASDRRRLLKSKGKRR